MQTIKLKLKFAERALKRVLYSKLTSVWCSPYSLESYNISFYNCYTTGNQSAPECLWSSLSINRRRKSNKSKQCSPDSECCCDGWAPYTRPAGNMYSQTPRKPQCELSLCMLGCLDDNRFSVVIFLNALTFYGLSASATVEQEFNPNSLHPLPDFTFFYFTN